MKEQELRNRLSNVESQINKLLEEKQQIRSELYDIEQSKKPKPIALAVDSSTLQCSLIYSPATYAQLKQNFDLYNKHFSATNWGGRDDIDRACNLHNIKPTGNKFKYSGVETGADPDHGHFYSWEFEYDEIMAYVEEQKNVMDDAVAKSTIREKIDVNTINDIVIDIRKKQLTTFNK